MWPAWEAISNTGSLLISACFMFDEDGEWLSFKLSLRGFLALQGDVMIDIDV